MEDQDGDDGLWQQNNLVPRCTGMVLMAGVYLAGLLACIVAGVSSPDLFVSHSSVFSSPSGISSPTSDYVFDITAYKRTHQSIFFSTRLNIPAQLQEAMDTQGIREYETVGRYNITVYGSPQPTVAEGDCLSGCVNCPDGNEALGLKCDLLSSERFAKERVRCEHGQEWCEYAPLYNVDFVTHTTYYWVVTTDNSIDAFIEGAGVDSPEEEEDWASEFRVVFVSQWYTGFELVWFYAWTIITLVVMFIPRYGFMATALAEEVYWHQWSRQQKWTGVLLVSLFFFNNPFFAAQIFSPFPRGFFIFFSVAEGILVALLLMYWLDRLFDIGRGRSGSRAKEAVARGAQWVLTILMFVAYVVNMIHIRLSRDGDPARVHKYPSTSSGREGTLAVLCFVYCAWVILLAARAWWWGGGEDTMRSSPRARFFVLSSCFTLIMVIPAIILEHLSPRTTGGVAFCIVHGGCNLYVMAMAVLCAPRYPQPPPIDSIDSGRAVNGINQPPLPGAGEEWKEDIRDVYTEQSNKWWKPKSRPRIADSSVWEDVQPGAVG